MSRAIRAVSGAMACSLIVFSALAQTAKVEKVPSDKAPPGVDEALRKRVAHFYQAHVDAKYRLADQVVAEDSKDFFFAAPKPKYISFEIVRTNYWEDFTKAEAVVACKTTWNIQGEQLPVTMPITTTWKLENGEWFWFWREPETIATPFGTMNYHSGKTSDPNAPKGPVMPNPAVLAKQILGMVEVDKRDVVLSSYEPKTEVVRITNKMQGAVTLRVSMDAAFAGLTWSLDKPTLGAGDTAVLKLICEPKDRVAKPAVTIRIYVDPTNQIFPVNMTFAVPPEIEKLLPKKTAPPKQ